MVAMQEESFKYPILFYLQGDESNLKKFYHNKTVEIFLDEDETSGENEIISVTIPNELVEDPSEICALLENSYKLKKEVWLSLAVSYALENKFAQSLDIVQAALDSKQIQNSGKFQKLPFHLFNSWLYLRQSRYSRSRESRETSLNNAQQQLDIAFSINPVSIEAMLARAVLNSIKYPDRIDENLDMFEKILKNDAGNVFALFGKAKLLYKKKHYNIALKTFQQILILNPTLRPDSRIGIGFCFWKLGDHESAINAWARSNELFPNDITSTLLCTFVNIDNAFNESLKDEELIEKYTKVITIISNFYNDNLKLEYTDEKVRENINSELVTSDYKRNPHILSIISSYLFSKNQLDVLIRLLSNFIKNNENIARSFNPVVMSDVFFWLARTYYTISITEGYNMSAFPESISSLNSNELLSKAQSLANRSNNFDNTNLYSKFLLCQIQYVNKDVNEAILGFEKLVQNFNLEAKNVLATKGFNKAGAKDKLIELHYMLGLLYHEKVFSEMEEIKKSFKSSNNNKSIFNNENNENISKSIHHLSTYLKLCEQLNEPVIINAYLSMTINYEYLNLYDKVAYYLEKAINSYRVHDGIKQQVPTELLNNFGVFQFLKSNYMGSKSFFELALKNENIGEDYKSTIEYNLARVEDAEITSKPFIFNTDGDDSLTASSRAIMKNYEKILSKNPNNTYAKLRTYYALATDPLYIASPENLDSLDGKIHSLFKKYESNLDVRAFYGWFIKIFKKKLKSYRESSEKGSLEDKLFTETLNKFDSHDAYSLISIANIYLSLARESKIASPKNDKSKVTGKENHYYLRATQLYQKALSIQPNNLYAAQGIGIIFMEMKNSDVALDIFKKIRDSLNDATIYINLGSALIDVKQFSKAIETYDIVINRFTRSTETSQLRVEENDLCWDVFSEDTIKKYKNDEGYLTTNSNYFSLLGRAWYYRGLSEKSLIALQSALKYAKKAYLVAYIQRLKNENTHLYLLPSLKFNIAFIIYQIADFIRKMSKQERNSDDISLIIENMKISIKLLEELANSETPPYPAEDLRQRAQMGSKTILNSLNNLLESQKSYEAKYTEKIQEGKKIQEAEMKRMEEERLKNLEAERLRNEKLKEEREKLKQTSLEWAEELSERNRLAELESNNKKRKDVDDDGFRLKNDVSDDDEDGEPSGRATKKRKVAKTSKSSSASDNKRKNNKKYKSADTIEDSDEDEDEYDKKNKIIDDDEDEDEDDEIQQEERKDEIESEAQEKETVEEEEETTKVEERKEDNGENADDK